MLFVRLISDRNGNIDSFFEDKEQCQNYLKHVINSTSGLCQEIYVWNIDGLSGLQSGNERFHNSLEWFAENATQLKHIKK